MTEVKSINELESKIATGNLVVVDFWAKWCGPCKMFMPTFTRISEELALKAEFCKVEIDEVEGTDVSFGIRSVPTIAIYVGGKEAKRFVGIARPDEVKNYINSL